MTVSLIDGSERIPGKDTVAWIPALESSSQSRSSEPMLAIQQQDKAFEPRVATVPVHSVVEFPNYDRVFHNVFSLSATKKFDLGLYRNGASKEVSFDKPGLVQIYCNIHAHMAAYLLVVESRAYAAMDEQGRATLEAIPAGNWKVMGWNDRAGEWSRTVTVQPNRTSQLDVELDISDWKPTPHADKHGEEYGSPEEQQNRY